MWQQESWLMTLERLDLKFADQSKNHFAF